MSKRMLMVLVAALATAWLAGSGYALENDWKTQALWHMDEVVFGQDANYVPDDDLLFVHETNREHTLTTGDANLVVPGYDGSGKCYRFDPNGVDAPPPEPNFVWNYADPGTFTFEGYLYPNDDANDRYVFATHNKQILVWLHDDDSDGRTEIVFSVKTSGDSQTHSLVAEYPVVDDWVYVGCSYDLDPNGNGIMTITTDDGTNINVVTVAKGVGAIAANADKTIYLGNYAKVTATQFSGRMDDVKLSKPPQQVIVAKTAPFEDQADTWALWHMDSSFMSGSGDHSGAGGDVPVVGDDDSYPANYGRRRDLTLGYLSGRGNLEVVEPGYDGTGRCLQMDPCSGLSSEDVAPSPQGPYNLGLWVYSIRKPEEATFKYEGWISTEEPNSYRHIHALYGQLDVQQNGLGSVLFQVKTWRYGDETQDAGDPCAQIFNTVTAEMLPTDAWQPITAEYAIDIDNMGSVMLETAVETAVFSDSNTIGPIAPHAVRVWMWFGNDHRANSFFHGRIDEVRISTPPQQSCMGFYGGDLNRDCYVNADDLGDLGEAWLATTDPGKAGWVLGKRDDYNNYNLPQTASPPTINGVIGAGEWSDAKAVEMVFPDIITPPQLGTQRGGQFKPDWPTPDDISGMWYFKWDATYLYVAAVIRDDDLELIPAGSTYRQACPPPDDVSEGTGIDYDKVEFGLNLYHDGNNSFQDTAFYYIGRQGDGTTRLENESQDAAMDPTNGLKASSITADGYIVEAALKWSDFDGYSPVLNDVHGMMLRLEDDDGYGVYNDFYWTGGIRIIDIGRRVSGEYRTLDTPEIWHTATLVSSLSCGEHGYLDTDANRDCVSNLQDFAEVAATWMKCTHPKEGACDDLN